MSLHNIDPVEHRLRLADIDAEIAASASRSTGMPARGFVGPMRPKPPFVPLFGDCETHGPYPRSTRIADVERIINPGGCPKCISQRAFDRFMDRAQIGARHADCTFDNFSAETPEQREVLERCREYAANVRENVRAGAGIILRGSVGTGKNHLATAIFKEAMRQGVSAVRATAFELVMKIHAAPFENKLGTIGDFARADLLLIDEVGRGYGSNAELTLLFHVINARYEAQRPTMLISNETKDGIRKCIGVAAYDRLRQRCKGVLNFDWDSARGGV